MQLTSSCSCGSVEMTASGKPIVSAVCYCADCQTGARQIEQLPGARPVASPDGGTEYILYRKDRIRCSKGATLLKGYKIKDTSPTNRVVATCCNTAMFVNFDKGPFWVSAYRTRFHGDLPPLQMRMCTRSKPASATLTKDLPSYSGFPPPLVVKLLASGAAMLLRL